MAALTTVSSTCSFDNSANPLVAVVSMALCSHRRVVYVNVNFFESIASQFLHFFDRAKAVFVAGFKTNTIRLSVR